MSNSCRSAVLLGLLGVLGAPVLAAPPPAPPAVPQAPLVAAPVSPPPLLSPARQKAARLLAQGAVLHKLAQATEREATRQARARQFDQAQSGYAKAASLYHQQARLARRSAQTLAQAGQLDLAARAHAEALGADNRYLACLADEVSTIKKSSAAVVPSPRLPAARPKPARTLAQAAPPVLVVQPLPARLPPKPRPRKPLVPVAAGARKPHSPSAAVRKPQPPLAAVVRKPHGPLAAILSISRLQHAARVRKALPPLLKALRQAAVHPLKFAAGLAAAQQHGLLQERLRLRRAALQGAAAGEATQPNPAPAAPAEGRDTP